MSRDILVVYKWIEERPLWAEINAHVGNQMFNLAGKLTQGAVEGLQKQLATQKGIPDEALVITNIVFLERLEE